MKILITGATGLVGTELVKQCLEQGIAVNYLTTSKSKITTKDNYQGFYYNPKIGEIDTNCFNGVGAVINLAGASISKRWTNSYKQTIINSRVDTLNLLLKSIQDNNVKIKHLISASAIGYYPDSLSNVYQENYPEASTSFLGQVVEQWETAIDQFKTLNIPVSKVRIGLVLSNKGGALQEMVKPIQMYAGAPFGSGKQWQSWVHVNDLASIFIHILKQQLTGIYNGVAPNPVDNTGLTKAIAKQLDKPLVLPNIPKFTMKIMLGEMHQLLFESQNVSSKKIEDSGFKFQFNTIEDALSDLL